jgi:hypothetical protein
MTWSNIIPWWQIVGKTLRIIIIESGKPTVDITIFSRRRSPEKHRLAVLYRYNGEGE